MISVWAWYSLVVFSIHVYLDPQGRGSQRRSLPTYAPDVEFGAESQPRKRRPTSCTRYNALSFLWHRQVTTSRSLLHTWLKASLEPSRQPGFVPIPKSINPKRILLNMADGFELSQRQIDPRPPELRPGRQEDCDYEHELQSFVLKSPCQDPNAHRV